MNVRSCLACRGLSLFALPLLAFGACKSEPATPATPADAGPDTSVQADTAATPDAAADAGGPSGGFVHFVKQANGANTATLASGSIMVNSGFGSSGNAFKYVAPNYYGTSSNGFIAFPTPMTGDFSLSAEITITMQNKANNVCGVGVGMTVGFAPTDPYAYVLMRNKDNATGGLYVSGPGVIAAGAPTVAFANGTALALSFGRSGKNITMAAGPVGETPSSVTVETSKLTDGTNVYGEGAVYPAISFNNVVATIAKLVIKDGGGATVFDSAVGGLVNYVPAALALSKNSVSMIKGASATVTATANAIGGAVSGVTAVPADPSIATVSVANGATSSTLTILGLKGGSTTVTVTNDSDTSATTNTKTILVAVNDYPTTDDTGGKALLATPAPGAVEAYPDGEFALTFDAAPTLNPGGSIKILKLSDGAEVDSVGFADEMQIFAGMGIKVGSQLVRVDGNTVFFTPHIGRLAYGTAYYVAIPTTSITGTLNGVAFGGLSNLSSVATWRFTTRAAPTLDFTKVTVDGSQTSSADFRSLATALNTLATAAAAQANVTIHVAAGTYREILRYTGPGASTPQTVTIVGPAGNKQGDNCVFEYANGTKANDGTQVRSTFYFTGANLVLQNIAFKNTAARSVYGQAETLYFASGSNYTLAATNSAFVSNQDTVQTSGRNWFYKCYIEGNVDFIWGTAQAALFEDCNLRVANDLGGGAASYSMVVARTGNTITTDGTVGKGYVLLNSAVAVDANVTVTFGRNAGAGAYYDQVAFVNVAFGGQGALGAGLWNTSTAPASMGDASYVGWKSAGCSGLNLASLTTAAGTSATIADQASEYDTRDHILNRVVTIKSGAPSGYEPVSAAWDVSSLATAWGAL